MAQGDHDHLFKIILLGDDSVGKTNLVLRFVHNEYNPNSLATIGVDFEKKYINVDGKVIKAQIWDTVGYHRSRSLVATYCRGAVGALLVYDITYYASYVNAKEAWLKDFRENADSNSVAILVGNKSDLNHRRNVPTDEAKAFAAENGLLFIETSGKDASNVENAFLTVVNEIFRRIILKNLPDESYLEILNRVPNQDFLKIFLGLLIGRCSISSGDSLSKDDAMLMNISMDGLRERLHEMHSILKMEPYIDVQNRHFLDFLQDSSRSGQYHVSKRAGTIQYLELVAWLLSRCAARLTDHGEDHFTPEFGELIGNLHTTELDIEDWEQALRPLLNDLNKLLIPSNIGSLMEEYCQHCQFFPIVYDTLTRFKTLQARRDPVVEKYLESLSDIISHGKQNFDMNFGSIVYGSVAIVGFLIAVLAQRR